MRWLPFSRLFIWDCCITDDTHNPNYKMKTKHKSWYIVSDRKTTWVLDKNFARLICS